MEDPKNPEKKNKESKVKETLYKVAYRNQITLIQIADNKANIIISINTMIISSIIAITGYGLIANEVEYDKMNIIPISIIVLSCLISAILAIQAARPKLMRAKNTEVSIEKSSLIFFGVIAKFSQAEYIEQMTNLISSDKEIYETMTIDLHNQGKILTRKYALLNHAYRIFMFGFILSVLIFLVFLAMR